MAHASAHKDKPAHTFAHILVIQYSGVRCLFCGRVFFPGKVGSLVSVRACLPPPAAVCVV